MLFPAAKKGSDSVVAITNNNNNSRGKSKGKGKVVLEELTLTPINALVSWSMLAVTYEHNDIAGEGFVLSEVSG